MVWRLRHQAPELSEGQGLPPCTRQAYARLTAIHPPPWRERESRHSQLSHPQRIRPHSLSRVARQPFTHESLSAILPLDSYPTVCQQELFQRLGRVRGWAWEQGDLARGRGAPMSTLSPCTTFDKKKSVAFFSVQWEVTTDSPYWELFRRHDECHRKNWNCQGFKGGDFRQKILPCPLIISERSGLRQKI